MGTNTTPTTTASMNSSDNNGGVEAAPQPQQSSSKSATLGASSGGDHHPKEGKKKKGLSLSSLKSPFKFLGKTYCKGCHKKCSGEVLRVNDVYFHNGCFVCKGCGTSLSQGGFFTKDKDYYCASCYQANFGTKCAKCNTFVEGEVVTALGKTYHQNCFKCAGCKKPFPTGERVTFTGKNCLCQKCANLQSNDIVAAAGSDAATTTATATRSTAQSAKTARSKADGSGDDRCAGCGDELKDGQALMALDKHFHVWCFKCKACSELLHGEYMGKDGAPYCEKDYQALFGVKCTYCFRFISGKVLQAGDNNHFHPTCARCTKCGEPFGDGEEMFLQGAAIWHPRCGPGPDEAVVNVNGGGLTSIGGGGGGGGGGFHPHQGGLVQQHHDASFDRNSTVSEQPPYGSRASSPGASLRRPYTPAYMYPSSASTAGDVPGGGGGGRFSRSSSAHMGGFSGSALYHSSSTYSLRRPIEPGDRTGSSSNLPQFHLPASRSRRSSSSNYHAAGAGSRSGAHTSMNFAPPTGGSGYRPISAPPKPGYTQASRGSTLPGTPSSGVQPPYRTTLQSPAGGGGVDVMDGRASQLSYSSATGLVAVPAGGGMLPDLTASRTYTHGFQHFQHSTPAPPKAPKEYKEYPLHLLLTTNFKMPPDVDRCNLEKHLNNADFAMVFQMSRDEFYALPLWRRNDYKRRVRLF